jgi:hypothetical protein
VTALPRIDPLHAAVTVARRHATAACSRAIADSLEDVISAARGASESAPDRRGPQRAVASRWHGGGHARHVRGRRRRARTRSAAECHGVPLTCRARSKTTMCVAGPPGPAWKPSGSPTAGARGTPCRLERDTFQRLWLAPLVHDANRFLGIAFRDGRRRNSSRG